VSSGFTEVVVVAGAAQRLAAFVNPACAWILVYPQAEQGALGEALRRQLGLRSACATTLEDARLEPAPDGLLTLAKAKAAAQRFWSACHARAARAQAIDRAQVAARVNGSTSSSVDPLTLVAVGGGSVMDLAKVMRWLPSPVRCAALAELHEEAWLEAMQAGLASADRLRLVVLPTTAGTGSETTPYATLWGKQKHSFSAPSAFADLAIIDYHLTLGTPWTLTRDCGLDALAHALDVLWNRASDELLRARATAVAAQIVRALGELRRTTGAQEVRARSDLRNATGAQRARALPDDQDARRRMAEAALQAGQLIARTESSLVHALSYPLTLREGLSHGLACAHWIAAVAALACAASASIAPALASIWGTTTGNDPKSGFEAREGASTVAEGERWAAHIEVWLSTLGVASRRINDEAGRKALAAALSHPRGRNFVGACAR
jgi:alcohol dehydrogenase class IV